MRSLLFIVAALLLASAVCMKVSHKAGTFPITGRVTLQSVETGNYMALCPYCVRIGSYTDSVVSVDEKNLLSPNAVWILWNIGNQVALLELIALKQPPSGRFFKLSQIPDSSLWPISRLANIWRDVPLVLKLIKLMQLQWKAPILMLQSGESK